MKKLLTVLFFVLFVGVAWGQAINFDLPYEKNVNFWDEIEIGSTLYQYSAMAMGSYIKDDLELFGGLGYKISNLKEKQLYVIAQTRPENGSIMRFILLLYKNKWMVIAFTSDISQVLYTKYYNLNIKSIKNEALR